MADFLKRRSVVTAGFVDLIDPHRVGPTSPDPRLGPYAAAGGALPPGTTATFDWSAFGADEVSAGTAVAVEFRGASVVDPQPWRAVACGFPEPPDAKNFPLDPLKAGDAHVRKYDDRALAGGVPRDWWARYYNRNVTDYVADPNQLMDPAFTGSFAGPNEQFAPGDVRYVNWRLVLTGDAERSVAPEIDSFWMVYRIEQE
ncbi:MAG: hypothetical protein AAF628_11425 [Planctomycetota bacterium]